MSRLVRALAQQDERERNWLLRDAFSHPRLNTAYCKKIELTLKSHGHKVGIPDDAYWAIDYTFTWVSRAFSSLGVTPPTSAGLNGAWSNQDVDLLIAFGSSIILIEAKGKKSHLNGQMKAKIERMTTDFGESRRGRIDVGGQFEMFFLLTSPKQPQKLAAYPGWSDEIGKFMWMELPDPRQRGIHCEVREGQAP